MNKKIISMLLLAAMAAGAAAGCSNNSEQENGGEIVINWTMPGPGKQADADLVWEEFNKQLKTYEGLENVTVNFDVISSSDYKQKFLMAQTSKEDMDIIQTYTLDFVTEARNGTFAPLDEYLDDELAETVEELPEFIFKYGDVDGQLYAITNYQMCPGMWAYHVKKDVADKYLDIEAFKSYLAKKEFDPGIFDVIEDFLSKAQAAGEMGKGFNPGSATMIVSRLFDSIKHNFYIDTYGDSNEVKFGWKNENMKKVFDKLAEWFEKGYIRKDILSSTTTGDDNYTEDGQIMYIQNDYLGNDTWISPKTGREDYVFYLYPNPLIPQDNAAGGLSISANSKNKEIAAKIINLMNCERGEKLYKLLVYGFEGQHYTVEGEDLIKPIGYQSKQGSSSAPYGLWCWVVGNTYYGFNTVYDVDNFKHCVFNEFNEGENTIVSRAIGFKPDFTKYTAKISQISAVETEYGALKKGAAGDVDKIYNEFITKLDALDIDEIKADIQEQLDAYMATQN